MTKYPKSAQKDKNGQYLFTKMTSTNSTKLFLEPLLENKLTVKNITLQT